MDKCIFCESRTSFKFKGEGEFKEKAVCPKCQSEKFNTNFNTGCANKDDCSVKLKRE